MYLGLDLGTSALKALLIDDEQRVIGSGQAPLAVSRPHSGWSEQDPAAWIGALRSALDALRQDHASALSAVRGIGLSGQMHGATLVDAQGAVIRPSILWNDTRSHSQAADLDRDPDFRAISGNIVFPGFTAPKLVWVRDHEPRSFARTAKVLLPKDYLRFWLSGEYVSEMSDAAGTSWLDTGQRAWSDVLLEKSHMRRDQMPELVEGSAVSAHLRADIAGELGLPAGIPVAGGAGDNAASACGMGTVTAGQAFLSLGTSGVLFVANDRYRPLPQSAVHAFCHALPQTWHQMGVILSATDALNWYAGVTGVSPADLTGALGTDLKAPGPLTFLPYLSGERTPHNDAAIRAAFVGLGHEAGRAVMTQAVLEGVAFAFADCMAALNQAGSEVSRVMAVGGGARSDYWLKVIATVLGVPVDIPVAGDFGAAYGAARLALIAGEGANPSTVCTPPPVERVIEPEAGLSDAFEDAYRRYKALYPALKGVHS